MESGELILHGYSTHTLGVKSNCELHDMIGRNFPEEYRVNVIPSLPRLDLKTSVSEVSSFLPTGDVLTSASVTLYNGETHEVIITITNSSNVPLEYIECSMNSNATQLHTLFTFCEANLQRNLPLAPRQSFDFVVQIFGEAEFVGPSQPECDGGPLSLQVPIQQQRVSSPISTPKRSELNSSFRGGSSGQSSLNTMSLGIATGQVVRQLDVQLKFRYAGGNGLRSGYCRQASIVFNVELLPSAQVTNWDVLPAEM